MDLGSYIQHEGKPAVRFERVYPHAASEVWSAITDAEEMATWLPFHMEYDAIEGGKVRFFSDPDSDDSFGTVMTWQPTQRFAFTWGATEVHLEVTPLAEDSSRLVLLNILEEAETAAKYATGWTICLHELGLQVAGVDHPGSSASLPFDPIFEKYVAAGVPSGS